MKINKSIKVALASAVMTVIAAGASFAAGPLTPGGAAVMPDLTTIGPGATLITSVTESQTSLANNYRATGYSAVYQESTLANPLGGLTFVFQIANAASTPSTPTFNENLDRSVVFGFLGFTSNAFYSTQAGGLGAGTLVPGGAFQTVSGGDGFRFEATATPDGVGLLKPGMTSDLLIIRTNATNYTTSVMGISDASTVNVASFAPTAAVPEPASVIPFALGGLGLLGLIARKTRRTSGAAA